LTSWKIKFKLQEKRRSSGLFPSLKRGWLRLRLRLRVQ